MNRYQLVDRFDSKTGKKLEPKHQESGLICDFCGNSVDEDDGNLQVKFKVEEVGGSEQTWYYHDFPGLNKDAPKFSGFDVFASHPNYVYCCDEDGESCSAKMLVEAIKGENLETVMQKARINVVVKLINSGVTPEELGISRGD